MHENFFIFFVVHIKSDMARPIILCLHGGTSENGFYDDLDWFRTTYPDYDYRIVPAVSSTPGWHSDTGKEDPDGANANIFYASVGLSINHIDGYLWDNNITAIHGILGYSMGGFMALYYAAYLTSIEFPFDKLWIFNVYMAVNTALNEQLVQITAPTFIMTGDNDQTIPPAYTADLANYALPNETPLFSDKTFITDATNDHGLINASNTTLATRNTLADFMSPLTATVAADGQTITLSNDPDVAIYACSWDTGYRYYRYTSDSADLSDLSPGDLLTGFDMSFEYVIHDGNGYIFRSKAGHGASLSSGSDTLTFHSEVSDTYQNNVIKVDGVSADPIFDVLVGKGIRADEYFDPTSTIQEASGPFLLLTSTPKNGQYTSIVKDTEAEADAADAHSSATTTAASAVAQVQSNVSCTFSGVELILYGTTIRNTFTFDSSNVIQLEDDIIKKNAEVQLINGSKTAFPFHITNDSTVPGICVDAVVTSNMIITLTFDAPIPAVTTANHFYVALYNENEVFDTVPIMGSTAYKDGNVIDFDSNVQPTNTKQQFFYLIKSESGLQSNGTELIVQQHVQNTDTTDVTVADASGCTADGIVVWDSNNDGNIDSSAMVQDVNGNRLVLEGSHTTITATLYFTNKRLKTDTQNPDSSVIPAIPGNVLNAAGSEMLIFSGNNELLPTEITQEALSPVDLIVSEAVVEKSSKYFQGNVDYPLTGPNIILVLLNHALDLDDDINTLGEYTTSDAAKMAAFAVTKNDGVAVTITTIHLENDGENMSAIQLTVHGPFIATDTNIELTYTNDGTLRTSDFHPIDTTTIPVKNLLGGRTLISQAWTNSKTLVCTFNHQVEEKSVTITTSDSTTITNFTSEAENEMVTLTFNANITESIDVTMEVYPAIYKSHKLATNNIPIEDYVDLFQFTIDKYVEATADITTAGGNQFGFLVADEITIDSFTYVSPTKVYSEIFVPALANADVFPGIVSFDPANFTFQIGDASTTVSATSTASNNLAFGKTYIDLEVAQPFEAGQTITLSYNGNDKIGLTNGTLFPAFSATIRNWLGPPKLTKIEVDETNILKFFSTQPVYTTTGSTVEIYNGSKLLTYTLVTPTTVEDDNPEPVDDNEDEGNQEETVWNESFEWLLNGQRIKLPDNEVIDDLRITCSLKGTEEFYTSGPSPQQYTLSDDLRGITTFDRDELQLTSISCELKQGLVAGSVAGSVAESLDFQWEMPNIPSDLTYTVELSFDDNTTASILLEDSELTAPATMRQFSITKGYSGWDATKNIQTDNVFVVFASLTVRPTRVKVFCNDVRQNTISFGASSVEQVASGTKITIPCRRRLTNPIVTAVRKDTADAVELTLLHVSNDSEETLILTLNEYMTDLTLTVAADISGTSLSNTVLVSASASTVASNFSAVGAFQNAKTLLIRFTQDVNIPTILPSVSGATVTFPAETQMLVEFSNDLAQNQVVSIDHTVTGKYTGDEVTLSNYVMNLVPPYVVSAVVPNDQPTNIVVTFSEKMGVYALDILANSSAPSSIEWKDNFTKLELGFATAFQQGQVITMSGFSTLQEAVGNQQINTDTFSVANQSTHDPAQTQSMESAEVFRDGKTLILTFSKPVETAVADLIRIEVEHNNKTTHVHTNKACSESSQCLLQSSAPADSISFDWNIDNFTAILEQVSMHASTAGIRGFVLGETDGNKFIVIVKDNVNNMPSDYSTDTPYVQLETKETPYPRQTWQKSGSNYTLGITKNAKDYKHTVKKSGKVSLPVARNRHAYGLFPGFTSEISSNNKKQVILTLPTDQVRVSYSATVKVIYNNAQTITATNTSNQLPHFIRYNLGIPILNAAYKARFLNDLNEAALYLCNTIDVKEKQDFYTTNDLGNFHMHFAIGAYETQTTFNGGSGRHKNKFATAFPIYNEVIPNSSNNDQGLPPFCGSLLNVCSKGPSSGTDASKKWKGGFNGAYLCVNKEGKAEAYQNYTTDHESENSNFKKCFHYYDQNKRYVGTKAYKSTTIQQFNGITTTSVTANISYFKEAETTKPNIVAYLSPKFTKEGSYTREYKSVEIDKHSSFNGTYTYKSKSNHTVSFTNSSKKTIEISTTNGTLTLNNLPYTMHNLVPAIHSGVPYTGDIHEPLLPNGGFLTCVVGSIQINRSRFFDGILTATIPPKSKRLYSDLNKKYVNLILHELLHCFGFHTEFSHFQFKYKNVRQVGNSKIGKLTFHGPNTSLQNSDQPFRMQTRNHFHMVSTKSSGCKEIMEPTNQNCLKVTVQTKAMLKDFGWNVVDDDDEQEFKQSS